MQKTDIIIPVYKPAQSFAELIDKLEQQTLPVHKILLVNTERKYWETFEARYPVCEKYDNIEVWHIAKEEFDHGRTRHEAVERSEAEIFVMMTDDAMPADTFLLEHLVKPLSQENAAVSYARQLARREAGPVEQFTREFNYPAESRIKTKEDIPELGIKTYFCSNVCAAYRRDIYEKLGGFVQKAIFNEDMIYAASCIQAGYRISYTAEAKVVHSHQYTNKEQFHRNFDLGVSQAEHPEVFESVPSESEGVKLVLRTAAYLRKKGEGKLIFPMCITSIYKFFGYKLGKNYKKLSFRRIMKYTMNKAYWKESEMMARCLRG